MIGAHVLDGSPGRLAEKTQAIDDEEPEQRRHHRAFRVMEEMAVAKHGLPVGGRTELPFRLLDQIFHDRAGLRDDTAVVLAHRRFAERMDALQRRRREHRLRSEEHPSALQSLMRTSYAVFCLKKQN